MSRQHANELSHRQTTTGFPAPVYAQHRPGAGFRAWSAPSPRPPASAAPGARGHAGRTGSAERRGDRSDPARARRDRERPRRAPASRSPIRASTKTCSSSSSVSWRSRIDPDTAGRLHTGRSRNDIDHTLFKMALRERLDSLTSRLLDVVETLIRRARAEAGTAHPGLHPRSAGPALDIRPLPRRADRDAAARR